MGCRNRSRKLACKYKKKKKDKQIIDIKIMGTVPDQYTPKSIIFSDAFIFISINKVDA